MGSLRLSFTDGYRKYCCPSAPGENNTAFSTSSIVNAISKFYFFSVRSSFAAHSEISCLLNAAAIRSGNLSGVQVNTGLKETVHCHDHKLEHHRRSMPTVQLLVHPPLPVQWLFCAYRNYHLL